MVTGKKADESMAFTVELLEPEPIHIIKSKAVDGAKGEKTNKKQALIRNKS